MEPDAQARLGEIYAPVLFLHRDDVAPISPVEYVRHSALWSNNALGSSLPAAAPAKNLWEGPDLLPGTIAASPDDPEITQRTLLWTHMSANPGRHFFLDHAGWDDHLVAPFPPVLEAGEVNDTTDNLMGSAGASHGRWDFRSNLPEVDHHIGWHSVQALDMADIDNLRYKLGEPVASQIPDIMHALPAHWMIFYHFFFPYRAERVSLCEFVRTMHELDIELSFDVRNAFEAYFAQLQEGSTEVLPSTGAPGPNINDPRFGEQIVDADLVGAGLPYSLPWAIHLGQFVTVALVVPEAPGGPFAPLNQFAPPLYVGFGQTAAIPPVNWGQVPVVPIMEIHRPAQGPGPSLGSMPLFGNHPPVWISPFTHNTHPLPGEYGRPVSLVHPPICDPARGGAVDEDIPVDEEGKRRRRFWVNLAKWLSSGVLFASISMAMESASDLDGGTPHVGSPPSDPMDSIAEDEVGLVLKPEDVDLPAELLDTLADDVTVRDWGGTRDERVFDENWEATNLRWGPPALKDPLLRRQGQPMPDFAGPFISELGRQLELGG